MQTAFSWRRRRDSNPRWNFRPTNDLANRPLQPLGYPSWWLTRVKYNSADVKAQDYLGVRANVATLTDFAPTE